MASFIKGQVKQACFEKYEQGTEEGVKTMLTLARGVEAYIETLNVCNKVCFLGVNFAVLYKIYSSGIL